MTFSRGPARWVGAHSQAPGLSFLFIITTSAILWFFAFFVPGQRQAAIGTWRQELSAVADTRRHLLDGRISEELAEASFVASFPSVVALVASARQPGSGERFISHNDVILSSFRKVGEDHSVSIRNAEGAALASSDGPAPGPDAVALAREAARTGESRIDLVREPDGLIGFVVAVPVFDSSWGSEAGAQGAVLIVGDAGHVFELLGPPVRAAQSGETLLVRKDGDQISFLSPLLFRKDPPLTFRLPFATPGLAARAALAGEDSFSAHVDYRNARILAAARRLARAPWGLVIKVDEDEALAPFRRDVFRKGLTWGGVLAALIAAAFGLWRAQVASQEATLVRSEARSRSLLQDVLDHSSALVYIHDAKGRFLFGNRKFESVLGHPREKIAGQKREAFMPEQVAARHRQNDLEVVGRRQTIAFEETNEEPDGQHVYSTVKFPLVDAQGNIYAVAGMSTDITERKAAEDRIGSLNRLLKTISDVNSLLIKVTGEESLFREVCRILVESGGYLLVWVGKADPETMRAVPVARAGRDAHLVDSLVVRWDDSPEGRGPFGTAIRTGRHFVVQETGTDPSTSPWRAFSSRLGIRSMAVLPLRRGGAVTAALVAYAAVPSFIDEEEITLLDELAENISFALDVLDGRERARKGEQELRRLSRAVEQTPASIVVTDLEGRIEYVNPGFTKVAGYTAEEAREQNPRILKSGRTPPEVIRQLWETITAGRDWYGELCNRRKDGTLYWEQASISPVRDDRGTTTHYVSVGEDVTARKAAAEELAGTQQQLLQAQKMEAVGRLAGGVAHDFNNLLTVIQGYGEMVRDSLSGDSRQESMEEVLKAAGRATSLTRQLLAFSRKQVLEPKIVRLGAIVRDTGRMLERLIGEDIALSLALPESLATVKADPGQVEQVILNLAVNARDAMPGGGRLTISVDDVTEPVPVEGIPEILPAGRWVRLTVEDTGCGMDAETLAHAFEPFFTTKERGKGTGLGLSTVYGIVRQSDGFVQVASATGKGTTFRIYLPRSDEEKTSGIRPSVLSRQGTETVLVVEDEPAVRNLVQAVLKRKGYNVLVAGDGAGALDIVDGHPDPIHVLLTDVVMPGMNGRDLAALVRTRRPSIKVILMSGYTADVLADLGTEGGPEYLSKPFTEQTLTAKLRETLDTPQS